MSYLLANSSRVLRVGFVGPIQVLLRNRLRGSPQCHARGHRYTSGLVPCHSLPEIEKTKLNRTERDRAFKKREASFRKTALKKKPILAGFPNFSDEVPNVSEKCSRPGQFHSFQASHAIAVQCHLRSPALTAQLQQVHRTPALVFRALPCNFVVIPVAASAPPSI